MTAQKGSHRRTRSDRRSYRRAWVVTSSIAVGLMIVTGIVFAISAGTRRITVHAQALHLTDEALRVATAARAQVGFANHLVAVQEEFGSDVTEATATSVEQARRALDALPEGLEQLTELGMPAAAATREAHERFVAVSNSVLDAVDAGDVAAARTTVEEALDPAYEAFFAAMEVERDRQLAEVSAADAVMARLGDVARFLVALLIPLAVIVIYREIVRRQQRQAELHVRLEAEREVGKQRDDFVANASHEFRTPLTSIYGLSQIIEEDPGATDSVREMASMISSEANDLSRMVEDLLTTAKLEADALSFQIEQVMTHEDAEDVLRPFRRNGIDIESSVKPAVVRVDRLRQRQILRNLISNARKYGGPRVRLLGEKQGDAYEWVVADDGEGVPEALEQRLFERFVHQGTKVVSPGGVGLGLSIVRALAEGMGGSVSYDRSDGWSRFRVRVPLALAQSPARRSESAEVAAGAFQVAASSPYGSPPSS